MKTLIILLLSFLLVSCGAVKKNKLSEKENLEEKTETKKSEELNQSVNSSEKSSVKIENNGYKISVKPIAGQNSFFNFTSPDGQVFKGETNAELNFEKKDEKKEILYEKKYVTVTTYKSQMTYKSQTIYKRINVYSSKEKSAYPWFYIFLAGVVSAVILIVLIKKLWTKFVQSQWYLQLISKIKK